MAYRQQVLREIYITRMYVYALYIYIRYVYIYPIYAPVNVISSSPHARKSENVRLLAERPGACISLDLHRIHRKKERGTKLVDERRDQPRIKPRNARKLRSAMKAESNEAKKVWSALDRDSGIAMRVAVSRLR